MQDNQAYRYFAFISYSSKDKKFAERIYQRITNFPLPAVLRNELEATNGKECPQCVKPLFLDITNLPAGQRLGETILKELNDSRFLLVICSPNSAKSDWVNQEVENFILMGRYDRIIPFIIKGTPNSGAPKTECFPPILRNKRTFITYPIFSNAENAKRHANLHAFLDSIHDELRGVSLSAEGSENSLMKIIARMLEIRPDVFIDLYTKQHNQQKQQQHKKKKAPWLLMIATFFLILCSGLGYWTWNRYIRVHIGYFADYVEHWSVPQGIFPLTPAQCAHRQGHYRIYTRNQKVIQLEHVNSAGVPIPVENAAFQDRPMIAVYSFYNDTRLIRRDDLDNNGNIVMSYFYSGNNLQRVEFRGISNDGSAFPKFLTSVTSPTNSLFNPDQEGKHSEIGNMSLIRNSEGGVLEQRFQKGSYNIPTTDDQGIGGFRYKLDEHGRVKEIVYLDQNGAPRSDKLGIARRTYMYNQENLVEIKYFDQKDNLVPNEQGWTYCINTYNQFGNIDTKKFIDATGRIFQTISYEYNDQGNITQINYLGIDDKPCMNKDDYAIIKWKYNDRGIPIEQAYFDVNDQPCFSRDNSAKITWKYDESGNEIEETYFGVDDQPILCNNGYAKLINKYDKQGNVIETAYFGIDDQPCLNNDGFAKVSMKYDEWRNKTEIAYFVFNNELGLCKDGYARVSLKYDERGNIIEQAYYGVNNLPCLCGNGYAKVSKFYDERGNVIKEAYFGIDNKPRMLDDNYAVILRQFDSFGNKIQQAYWDMDNKPCLHKDGFSKIIWKYNQQGNASETAYFDVNDKPCLCKDGYAKVSMKYDEQGNVTQTAYFDVYGFPCLCRDGHSIVTMKYDDGNLIEVAYWGIDGQLCLHAGNYAKIKRKYNKHGEITEYAFFGVDDEPCLCDDGYAKIVNEFDERGNVTKKTYYDAQGKIVHFYVVVGSVSPDSNGERYGIKSGDVFVLYDGQLIDYVFSFTKKRSEETGDAPHKLLVLRDKEFIEIQIHPGILGCILNMKAISGDQQSLVVEKLKETKND